MGRCIQNRQAAADDKQFFFHCRRQRPIGHGGNGGAVEGFFELVDAFATVADDGNYWHAELFLQSFR